MVDVWGTVVGAGAVIAGAVLTGGFTLLKGRQEGAEKERDRLEQRAVRHRELRRDAYLALLNAGEEIYALQDQHRDLEPAARVELNVTIDATLAKLHQCLAVVRLEGPAHVAESAEVLVNHYRDLTGLVLVQNDISPLMRARMAALGAQSEFLAAASAALDSER
ncbi:hypothetical protein [Streptomyces sp. NPDC088733]|uniref:hypothetical protein n=1 Tax=Streptomyces sp. NPDC088733 TaxID=3365880 RepID=UPI0037FD1279